MFKKVNFICYIDNYFIFIYYKEKTKIVFRFMLINDVKNVLILYNVSDLFGLIYPFRSTDNVTLFFSFISYTGKLYITYALYFFNNLFILFITLNNNSKLKKKFKTLFIII